MTATGLARSTASRARAGPFWASSMTSGRDDGAARCSTVKRQFLAVATQIEVAVAPGVELGGAAQGLAGADASSALPGVVHDEHGDAVPTLQLAQIGEQGRDLAAGVLVDAVQPHERIEDEQTGPQSVDGVGEAGAIGIEIEAEGALGVISERGDQLRRHQLDGAGLLQAMQQQLLQLVRRGALQRQAHPHAAAERGEFLGAQALQQPTIAGEHDGQQDVAVEAGG